jgi:hypothetical protein
MDLNTNSFEESVGKNVEEHVEIIDYTIGRLEFNQNDHSNVLDALCAQLEEETINRTDADLELRFELEETLTNQISLLRASSKRDSDVIMDRVGHLEAQVLDLTWKLEFIAGCICICLQMWIIYKIM